MTSVTTLRLAHLPPDLVVHIALYTSLQNASFLRSQLLQGNSDFEYAFIDATTIISTTHILAAIFRAARDHLEGRLKSRNVHSEIVFSLGMNNNIAQSLRTFGLTDKTTNLLAVKLSTNLSITHDSVYAHLASAIQGTMVDFNDQTLADITDTALVKKIYRLGKPEKGGKGGRRRKDGELEGTGKGVVAPGEGGLEGERERKELEVAALGLMALRGAV